MELPKSPSSPSATAPDTTFFTADENARRVLQAEAERIAAEAERRRLNHERVAAKWRFYFRRVRAMLLLSRHRPVFSIENISALKPLFLDEYGRLIELRERDFVRIFSAYFGPGTYTEKQLVQWFSDIDVDAGDTISWDEFTNFCIHEAVGVDTEYSRAKEFLPQPHPSQAHFAHRETARLLLVNTQHDTVITAGFDGFLKVWNAETMEHVKTINNTKNSVAYLESASGLSSAPCPIVDLVSGAKGNIVFVAAVDKSVHLYEAHNMNLVRRYIGRNRYNELDISSRFVGGSRAPVDTVLLMHMEDTIATMDVATVEEREFMFFGYMDGRVAAYLALRNSSAVEIFPKFVVNTHSNGSVAKLRFIPCLGALLSCGWDRALVLTDPKNGTPLMRFRGGTGDFTGHSKAAFDFCVNRRTRVMASIANERDIFIWNVNVETPITKLKGHTALLIAVAFNENENQLISLSQDNQLKIWDMRHNRLFQTFSHTDSFSKLLAIGYCTRRSQIFGLASEVHSWSIRRALAGFGANFTGHIEPIVSVELMEAYNSVVTCDPHTAMTWDLVTGQRQIVWRVEQEGSGGDESVATMALDWRSRRMIAVTKARQVLLYNHRNTQLLRDINCGSSSVALRLAQLQTEQQHRRGDDAGHARGEEGGTMDALNISSNEGLFDVVSVEKLQRMLQEDVPLRVLHIANGELSQKYMCVLTKHDLFIIRDFEENIVTTRSGTVLSGASGNGGGGASSYDVHRIVARRGRFTTMCMYPVPGKVSVPSLVCGTTAGQLMIVSVASAAVLISIAHPPIDAPPLAPDIRAAAGGNSATAVFALTSTTDLHGADDERNAIREIIGESNIQHSTNVEAIAYVDRADLFVTTLGGGTLYFWDLRRTNAVRLVYHTRIFPSEHIGHLSVESSGRLLAAGDDQGYVYLRDIAAMPENRASAEYRPAQISLLHVFKAHTGGLVQLRVISVRHLITAGNDSLVKLFCTDGTPIGCFGQPTPWWLSDSRTWGRHERDFAAEVEKKEMHPYEVPLPKDASHRGRRRASRTVPSPAPSSPATPQTAPLAPPVATTTTIGRILFSAGSDDASAGLLLGGSFNGAATFAETFSGSLPLPPPSRGGAEMAVRFADTDGSDGARPPAFISPPSSAVGNARSRSSGSSTTIASYRNTLSSHPTTCYLPMTPSTRRPKLTSESSTATAGVVERLFDEGRKVRATELLLAQMGASEPSETGAFSVVGDVTNGQRSSLDAIEDISASTIAKNLVLQLADESKEMHREARRVASRKERNRPWRVAQAEEKQRTERLAELARAAGSSVDFPSGDESANGSGPNSRTGSPSRQKASTPMPLRSAAFDPSNHFSPSHLQRSVGLSTLRAMTPSANTVLNPTFGDAGAGVSKHRIGIAKTAAERSNARRGIVAPCRVINDSEDDADEDPHTRSSLVSRSSGSNPTSPLPSIAGRSSSVANAPPSALSVASAGGVRASIASVVSSGGRDSVATATVEPDVMKGARRSVAGKYHRQSLFSEAPRDDGHTRQSTVASLFEQQRSLATVLGGMGRLASRVVAHDSKSTAAGVSGAAAPGADDGGVHGSSKPFSIHDVRAITSEAKHRIDRAIVSDPRHWTSRAAGLLPLNALELPTRSTGRIGVGDSPTSKARSPTSPKMGNQTKSKPRF